MSSSSSSSSSVSLPVPEIVRRIGNARVLQVFERCRTKQDKGAKRSGGASEKSKREVVLNTLRYIYGGWGELQEIDASGAVVLGDTDGTAAAWLRDALCKIAEGPLAAVRIGWVPERSVALLAYAAENLFGTQPDSSGFIRLSPTCTFGIGVLYGLLDILLDTVPVGDGGSAERPTQASLSEWLVRFSPDVLSLMVALHALPYAWALLFQNVRRMLQREARGFGSSAGRIDWASLAAMQLVLGTTAIQQAQSVAPTRRALADAILGDEAIAWRMARTSLFSGWRVPNSSMLYYWNMDSGENNELQHLRAFGYPWFDWLDGSALVTGSALFLVLTRMQGVDVANGNPVERYLELFPDADLNLVMRRHHVGAHGGSVYAAAVATARRFETLFRTHFPGTQLLVEEHENMLVLHCPDVSSRVLAVHALVSEDDGADLMALAPSPAAEGVVLVTYAAHPDAAGTSSAQAPRASTSVRERPVSERKKLSEQARQQLDEERYRRIVEEFRTKSLTGGRVIEDLAQHEHAHQLEDAMRSVELRKAERVVREQRQAERTRAVLEVMQGNTGTRGVHCFMTVRMAQLVQWGAGVEVPSRGYDQELLGRLAARGFAVTGGVSQIRTMRRSALDIHGAGIPEDLWEKKIKAERKSYTDGQARTLARTLAESLLVVSKRDDWRQSSGIATTHQRP